MKLTELEPQWLEREGVRIAIMLLCPHCIGTGRRQWLTCFFVKASSIPRVVSEDECINGVRGERVMFEEAFRKLGYPDPRREAWEIVSCNPDCQWTRTTDDFATMSITPSLDASASGHWHGFITNGEIV